MNQALKREIELAQYAALKGDANSFFTHEERIFSMDVHNDAAPIDLLNKLRLIAALRSDKFKTATEVWDAMKGEITKQDKIELWNHLLSAPEISDSDYTELIHIIVGDPNQKSSLLTNNIIMVAVMLFLVLLGGWIIWETDFYDIRTKISNKYFEEESDSSRPETVVSDTTTPSNEPLDAVQLFEYVSPSVVMFVNVCDIQMPDGTFRQFYFGHGSGFVIDDEGTVITNKHVVDVLQEDIDDMNNLWSQFGGVVANTTLYGLVQKPEPHHVLARVIFRSPDIDLAVVKLDETHLLPVQLAGKNPKVGSDVVVIGYRGTTQDVIQNMDKQQTEENLFDFMVSDTSALVDYMWSPGLIPSQSDGKISSIFPKTFMSDRTGNLIVLETSAMCSGGNSGGPMFDMHKNVVGMLTWKLSGDSAINLCISAETINMILKEWQESQ